MHEAFQCIIVISVSCTEGQAHKTDFAFLKDFIFAVKTKLQLSIFSL